MNRIAFVSVLSLVIFASNSISQTPPQLRQHSEGMAQRQGGMMMQGMGMMRQGMGMMGNDMMNCSTMLVHRALMGSREFYLDRRDFLGLTDEQVETLREIRLDAANTTKDIESELGVARIELQDMLEREPVNVNAVSRKLEDVHSLEAELESEQIKAMVEARKVLTLKQQKLLDSDARRMMEQENAVQEDQSDSPAPPSDDMSHDHDSMR